MTIGNSRSVSSASFASVRPAIRWGARPGTRSLLGEFARVAALVLAAHLAYGLVILVAVWCWR